MEKIFNHKKHLFAFFFCMTFCSQIVSAQRDTIFHVYALQWGGYSLNERCAYSPNLAELNKAIKQRVDNAGRGYKFMPDADQIYENLSDSIQDRRAHICIFPFIFCDNNYITIRGFVLEQKRQDVLIDQFSFSGLLSKDSIAFLLMKNIVSRNYSSKLVYDIYFRECTFLGKLNYFYKLNAIPRFRLNLRKGLIDQDKRYNVDDVVAFIQRYCLGQDPGGEAIKKLYYTGNIPKKKRDTKAKKSLGKISDSKLKIWKLVDDIRYFEEYKENTNPADGVLENLLRKIERLNNDDSEFSSDELDSYAGKLNYDSIVAIFTKGVALLYNCEKIKQDAEDLEKRGEQDELAILYFDILHTQDISAVKSEDGNSISSSKNSLPCASIRKTAFDWCKSYLAKKSATYQSTLKNADDLFEKRQYDKAQKRYEDADILSKSLSLYPKYMSDSIDKIFKRKKIDLEKEANKIVSRIYKSNISTPGMLNQRLETIANSNKEIVFKFYQENDVWKEWFAEFKYRKGIYFSANDELIAENLAMTLNQIYQELGSSIASISISFTGSADNAPFISDEPIKLIHPGYEKLQDQVCQCLKPRQPIEDQICLPFQELRNGKLGSKSQKGSLRKTDNNYLKNNALAFLRAYHQKTLVERYLLNGYIPRDKLTYGICSVVSEQKGGEFRYVNVEIHILFNK